MSRKEESYWKKKTKYAFITTIIIFFVGGVFGWLLDIYLPQHVSFDDFITVGLFSIIILWTGIIIGRYLIKFGVILESK